MGTMAAPKRAKHRSAKTRERESARAPKQRWRGECACTMPSAETVSQPPVRIVVDRALVDRASSHLSRSLSHYLSIRPIF